MERSTHCDGLKHDDCDGSVTVFDQDGPTRYVCSCSCHNVDLRERDCPSCRGTGRIHDRRRFGRFSTEPGPIPT